VRWLIRVRVFLIVAPLGFGQSQAVVLRSRSRPGGTNKRDGMATRQFQIISSKDFLPAGVHDDLWQFLAYWRAKAATRLPRRREIDPLDIARLLPRICLLDVEPADFRFSLVGEEITARYGQIRGKSLGELMSGPELTLTLEEHRLCVSTQLPVFSQNSMQSASPGDQHVYQRLLTPFAADGDVVACLAGVIVFRAEKMA